MIAVLGVAGLGLLADRVIIGSDVTGPAQSSAGVIDGFDPTLVDPVNVEIDPTHLSALTSDPGVSFAQRLREAVGDTTEKTATTDLSRNAFTPPQGWQTASPGQVGTTDNTSSRLAREFQSKYTLEAVMVLGDKRYAVIGGQTLHIGQEVNGYKLTAVHERSATFERNGIKLEVGIATGSTSP